MRPERYSLGLVGYPLEHSLSPRLHAAALQSAGLEGEYRLYPIYPGAEGNIGLQSLLARMRIGEIHGLNLTIPHKRSVIPLLDNLTLTAEAVGAVNTIYINEGKLVGDNTDVAGFHIDLDNRMVASSAETHAGQSIALVLGAGGSARAVVYALRRAGWGVHVAARRMEQAQALVQGQEGTSALLLAAEAVRELLAKTAVSLIVNTTPLGMGVHLEGCAWPLEVPFPRGATIYDLVYNPPETRLVRAARASGLPAANGLGMLVEQAALAFTTWTGISPSRDVLWAAVRG